MNHKRPEKPQVRDGAVATWKQGTLGKGHQSSCAHMCVSLQSSSSCLSGMMRGRVTQGSRHFRSLMKCATRTDDFAPSSVARVCAILGFATRPSFSSCLIERKHFHLSHLLFTDTHFSLHHSIYFFLSVCSLIASASSICTHTHISMVNRVLVRRVRGRVRVASVNECRFLRWETLTLLINPPKGLHLSLFQNRISSIKYRMDPKLVAGFLFLFLKQHSYANWLHK